MTSPATSLPFAIRELMVNTTVLWEQAGATDAFFQPAFAAPVEINCWMEPEGVGTNAGLTSSRAGISGAILEQTRRPELSLYFDGDDANVRSFRANDRFTLVTPGSEGIAMMATVIETFYGPPFDNTYPWTVRVGF